MPIDSHTCIFRDGLWLNMCKFCAGGIWTIGSTYEQDQKIVAINGCKLYLFFSRYCSLDFCRNLSHTAPHSVAPCNQSVPEGPQCVPVEYCTCTYTEIEARDGQCQIFLLILKVISLIINTLFIINWNTIQRVSSALTHLVHIKKIPIHICIGNTQFWTHSYSLHDKTRRLLSHSFDSQLIFILPFCIPRLHR